MGWMMRDGATVADVRRERLERLRDVDGLAVLGHATVGNRLWIACDRGGERFVVLYLIERSGGMAGYKGMDESMGPCHVDCPMRLLDATEETSHEREKWAIEWRAEARRYAETAGAAKARRAKYLRSVKAGDTVSMRDGRSFRVIEERRGSFIVSYGGGSARLAKRHVVTPEAG